MTPLEEYNVENGVSYRIIDSHFLELVHMNIINKDLNLKG